MCIKQLFFVVLSFLCSVMWIVVCFLSIVVRVFVFYPLWCESLFFIHCGASLCFFIHCGASLCVLSIVVPVFAFYPLWCQSLCFIHCGASLCALAIVVPVFLRIANSDCPFLLSASGKLSFFIVYFIQSFSKYYSDVNLCLRLVICIYRQKPRSMYFVAVILK